MEHVTITTKDGVDIAGLWWDASGEKTALLFHMMPATKESWYELGQKLFDCGMNVLAIDFRGHGESGGGDYRTFTDDEHHKYLIDARAAVKFVIGRLDDPVPDLVMCGASIGANVALRTAIEYEQTENTVLISPGLNYHGIKTDPDVRFSNDPIYAFQFLFVTSKDDGDNAEQTARLRDIYRGEIITYQTGGHGTDLFVSHPELVDTVANFLLG